jgi:hypothetical protein
LLRGLLFRAILVRVEAVLIFFLFFIHFFRTE